MYTPVRPSLKWDVRGYSLHDMLARRVAIAMGTAYDGFGGQFLNLPPKVLVIPRKRWLHPNMTEKLFTWTLSIKQTKNNF